MKYVHTLHEYKLLFLLATPMLLHIKHGTLLYIPQQIQEPDTVNFFTRK